MNNQIVKIQVDGGLNIVARRYSGGAKGVVVCIPGLTRNGSDFDDLAPGVADLGFDVYAVSLRGRGPSDRDPDYRNYRPEIYSRDIAALLDHAGAERAIFIGTSLGGIVTMVTGETAPGRIRGTIINDVGPDLAPEGIARIASYVGKDPEPAASIEEAAARIKAINGVAFPGASLADWIKFAKRTFRRREDGKWELDYDPNIARAVGEEGPAPDLWAGFESLKRKPTLLIRGALSDLLTPPIVEKMRKVHPHFEYCEVPRIGHAPMMTEPAAWAAIEKFLTAIE